MIIDAHLDLAYNAWLGRDIFLSVKETRTNEGPEGQPPDGDICTVGLPDLLHGGIGLVFGSIFTDPAANPRRRPGLFYSSPEEAHAQALIQLDFYHRLAGRPDVLPVRNRSDLDSLQRARQDGPVLGLLIEMEGAEPILSIDDLYQWHQSGVRQIGLAWAFGNRYCGGNMAQGTLTPAGEELVREMNRMNMILDVSHLADDSFWRALELFQGPIVASHTGCRALVPGPRQLSDAMIRAIAERQGMFGIVMFNAFLKEGWTRQQGKSAVTLTDVIRHIDHIARLAGGTSNIGIGSDMDGGLGRDDIPAELDSIADLHLLGPALAAAGYSPQQVRDMMCGNWLRLLYDVLPAE